MLFVSAVCIRQDKRATICKYVNYVFNNNISIHLSSRFFLLHSPELPKFYWSSVDFTRIFKTQRKLNDCDTWLSLLLQQGMRKSNWSELKRWLYTKSEKNIPKQALVWIWIRLDENQMRRMLFEKEKPNAQY